VKLPLVKRFRLPSPTTKLPRSAPLGVTTSAPLGTPLEDGDAIWITPPGPVDAVSLSLVLPEPPSIGVGLVIISPIAGETGLMSRLLGREVRIPRAIRGSALLLAGYRNIGGAIDPASGLDLCWGEA
jgi:hypothetical protein